MTPKRKLLILLVILVAAAAALVVKNSAALLPQGTGITDSAHTESPDKGSYEAYFQGRSLPETESTTIWSVAKQR